MTVFAATVASPVSSAEEHHSAPVPWPSSTRPGRRLQRTFPERRSDRAIALGITLDDADELEFELPWLDTPGAWFGTAPANIRAWLAAGRPAADRDQLAVVGDPSIVAAVRSAVARMPECFAWFVVGNVVIRCSGIETIGWCHVPIRPPCAEPIDVVVTRADECIVAHELMHAFQLERLPMFEGLDAAQLNRLSDGLRELAVEEGRIDERADLEEASELAADSLAYALGFDIDVAVRAARRHRRRAARGMGAP